MYIGLFTLVVALSSQAAHAELSLRPSNINGNGGGCVAASIISVHPKHFFFSDLCSEFDYYIGLNGFTYKLRRVSNPSKKSTGFTGHYSGEGVSVEIKATSGRLNKCEYLTDSEMESLYGVRRVVVVVWRGNRSARIEGIYNDCP